MHDASFSEAVCPSQSIVLNLVLRPYSIGHEVLLFSKNNPLLLPIADFNQVELSERINAVMQGALICSHDWSQNQKPKGDRWITKFIKANRNQDYAFATAAFYKYRAAGSLYPPAPSPEANLGCNGKEEGGREFGSPFLASLYNFVCGLPESERALHGDSAFDFPLGFATFLYYSKLELDGNMRVENAREAQFKNEFKSAVNAILKEKVENG